MHKVAMQFTRQPESGAPTSSKLDFAREPNKSRIFIKSILYTKALLSTFMYSRHYYIQTSCVYHDSSKIASSYDQRKGIFPKFAQTAKKIIINVSALSNPQHSLTSTTNNVRYYTMIIFHFFFLQINPS